MIKRHILLTAITLLAVLEAAAQPKATPEIRYVASYGKYENDGKSWKTAKKNIQDAINDLADKNIAGEVWVAQGTYSPTESTESSGGSTLYMSFKVPAGITVRGGFYGLGDGPVEGEDHTLLMTTTGGNDFTVKRNGTTYTSTATGIEYEGEATIDDRMLTTQYVTVPQYDNNGNENGTQNVEADKVYTYETILTGDLSQAAKFQWNEKKNYWQASFYGNCYHVVWFATNGFDSDGRAKALNTDRGNAMVEGFTIKNGNAKNNDLSKRFHNAYGGGVYMVKGSRLENCHVTNCEASRDGGGIYMDGGGIVKHCYISNCQALGIGVLNGYGGGVCIDANPGIIDPTKGDDERMGIYRSGISGNVGRMGGGLAIKYDNSIRVADAINIKAEYLPFASAVLVANNTATTEGGGIYTIGGGAMTNMTIVRNKCNGTGVISNGMATGRAGGLYCRDHALVLNSVLWGNECKANNDIQYAATRSSAEVQPIDMKFCAVTLSDYVDWSSTTSDNVFNIANYNNGIDYKNGLSEVIDGETVVYYEGTGKDPSRNDVFPNFYLPSKRAGYYSDVDNGILNITLWRPSSNSGLTNAGIVSHNLNVSGNSPFVSAPQDILDLSYTSYATIGAYTRTFGIMEPAANGVDSDGDGINESAVTNEYHFFVDPNAPTYRNSTSHGSSWDSPAANIGDVLHNIKERQIAGITDWDNAKFYIHIKEGEARNVNSYTSDGVRNTMLMVSSNITILGGYPDSYVGCRLKSSDGKNDRNPSKNPTFVRGDIFNNYDLNVARMFVIYDKNAPGGIAHDVTIDGLQVRNINARYASRYTNAHDGGAFNISAARNITIRNTIIAGCTAVRGPAVYVHNSQNVTLENCIIHNNEAKHIADDGGGTDSLSGVVFIEAESYHADNKVTFEHCNLMNNVGHAIMLHSGASMALNNSMLFANTHSPVAKAYYNLEREKEAFSGNMAIDIVRTPESLETEAAARIATSNPSLSFFTLDHTLYDEYTSFDGGTTYGTLRYLLNAPNAYPRFVNGVVNTGVSSSGDMTFYGRATSFQPHNENPMVNAASYDPAKNPTTTPGAWGYDLTTVTPRTFGGLPDVGAIENHVATEEEENAYNSGQQPFGSVVYVRDYHTYVGSTRTEEDFSTTHADGTLRDGTSWTNAINGNAVYDIIPEEVTTTVTTVVQTLQTSTVANQANKYKIAMLDGATATGLSYFAYYNTTEGNIRSTIDIDNADEFILIASENYYQIYNIKSGLYVGYTNNGNSGADNIQYLTQEQLNTTYYGDNCRWLINKNSNTLHTFTIVPYLRRNDYADNRPSWNYHGGVGNKLGLYNSSDANSKWQFFTTTTTTTTTDILGLRHAIDIASTAHEADNNTHDVYVGAGKYTDNITFAEGVNVLGGFPRTGNPGENERNISNTTEGFMTIIDGNQTGRVLTQAEDFADDSKTMFEGFVIQNGRSSGTNYGAGIYLRRNGIIKNCLIHSNEFEPTDASLAGGGGIYISYGGMIINSIIKWNTMRNSTSKLIGGAGVHSNGGTLQNSLIVENTAYTTGINVLGAGFYISALSNIYNCTIAYNVGNNTGVDNPTNGQTGPYACTGGVWDASAGSQGKSQFYNCIIWGNYATGTTRENFYQVGMSGFSSGGGIANDAFHNCYSSASTPSSASDVWNDEDRVFLTNTGNEINSYPEFYAACKANEPFKKNPDNTTDYSLSGVEGSTSIHCINKGGSQDILEDMGITEDIVGDPRILDCTVDKGAYEFYDSYAITPRTIEKNDGTVDYDKPATFYVTPEGRGLASGHDPGNAACAAKLQRVLDAAGRYKFRNPNQQVIVKVAQYDNDNTFTYYATRTTDVSDADKDVRLWSIIVPRGVEVWGGYNTSYSDDNNNGFYQNTVDGGGNVIETKDNRDITKYQTIFDSHYIDNEDAKVTTYHVVTFTDKIFDGEGKPYRHTDRDLNGPSSWQEGDAYLSLGSHGSVKDRAVIDGIFITGGQANLKVTASGSEKENINSYGGGAIVTDYAHVRNCIVKDNHGTYGGGLALMHNALVTGCLIHQNSADYGGAIYVFRDSTNLSDDTMMDTYNANYKAESIAEEHRLDFKMPKVYSTTIVNNDANVQGGGVWFYDNVRFTGVAIWQNRCSDQANISGQYNKSRTDGQTYFTTEYFPFNYSAIQSIQPSGINNVALGNTNEQGARFNSVTAGRILAEDVDVDGVGRFADYGFFHPSDYSILTRGGIPVEIYDSLYLRGIISNIDFLKESRTVSTNGHRRFIEIGALSVDKVIRDEQLMLRLFVAGRPEDMNPQAALAVQQAAVGKPANSYEAYYAQEGSSFAYPFQRLQDALDYIYYKRGWKNSGMENGSVGTITEHANNMSFEIWLGAGEYIPSVDLTGNFRNFVGNTFAIPEGVTLIGGFDPAYACTADGQEVTNDASMVHFYGGYNTPHFYAPDDNGLGETMWDRDMYYVDMNKDFMYKRHPDTGQDIISDGSKIIEPYYDIKLADSPITYRLHHVYKDTATVRRTLEDINANSIIEPWEFANQTILTGESSEYGTGVDAVNHILTVVPNQAYVGALPLVQGEDMFDNPTDPADPNYGYIPHEHGQIVALDGLTFTGGYARGYKKNTIDDEHKMKYNHGGAILVDGNRYFNYYNKLQEFGSAAGVPVEFRTADYKHANRVSSAGFREIPLMINACKFDNNTAGYGGAISTNTTLDVMNCSFVHNRALSGNDTLDFSNIDEDLIINYPGAGGAIYSTYQVSGVNSLFANNEADDPDNDGRTHFGTYNILSDLIYSKLNGTTPVTREMYPGSGGAIFSARRGYFHFMNCNFVRNKALAYPAIFTMNPNYQAQIDNNYISLKDYNQAINCVFWGNSIDKRVIDKHINTPERNHLFVMNRIVNYGLASRGTDGEGGVLADFNLGINEGYTAMTTEQLDHEVDEGSNKGYTEQVWFSAYEPYRGKTPKNNLDLRNITFHPRKHIKKWIETEIERTYGTGNPYQNSNILIDTLNNTNEGPNFVNPSRTAGYEGYEESADWSPARLNNLTDNGWGKIEQDVALDPATNKYSTVFLTYNGTGSTAEHPVPIYPVGRTTADPDDNNRIFSSEAVGTYAVNGAYTTLRFMNGNEKYQKTMPIGTQRYMFTTYIGDDGNLVPLPRISYDPNPSHNQTFIDIGVYEYNHTQLRYTTEADAVDVLWVSATEKPDNGLPDGSDWSQPTSDLQRAIETLLSSRNGHRKEIRLMNGTFTPIYTIDDNLAFYINTMYQNGTVILDYKYKTDANGKLVLDANGNPIIDTENGKNLVEEGLGVKSLTIKGGYSFDLAGMRNVDLYPAIIKQQQRTDNTSTRWNHLFYIKDPTQRYGLQNDGDYGHANGFGNLKDDTDNTKDVKTISTIPIEFDGVTLINDQALPGTKGSAIYYANLSDTLQYAKDHYSSDKFDNAQTEIKSTPVNVTTRYQVLTTDSDGKVITYDHNYTSVSDPAKILISKSKIIGSGSADGDGNSQSAVYLGDNHGHAIVYNNVLHSNYGQPIDAGCRALTVNNTFALNGGYLNLQGDSSMIHNSVLWKNNPTAKGSTSYNKQFYLKLFGDSDNASAVYTDETKKLLSYNSYTNGPTESTDYSSDYIDEEDRLKKAISKNFNTKLDDDNSNFLLGPNFAKVDGDVLELDFNIMPSLRLMNRGLNENYDTLQVVDEEAAEGVLKDFKATRTLYDMAINTTYGEDAASMNRFTGSIDIGAYEYQKTLRRVFYVDPLKTESKTGESWEEPVGQFGIQDAIDLAALYNSSHPNEQAFVFVKGAGRTNKEFHTGEAIILRNGVSIYGGIDNTLYKVANVTKETIGGKDVELYTDKDIKAYLDTLSAYNEGFVGPNTSRTAINGIYTNEHTVFDTDLTPLTADSKYTDEYGVTRDRLFPITSEIMGFHVTSQRAVTSPVINIDPQVSGTGKPKVALRMLAVYDNNVAANATDDMKAAVYLKNALIYGSLFRDNNAGMFSDKTTERAVIRLDEDAWAVNISAQGKTETFVTDNYKSPFNGYGVNQNSAEEKNNRIVNSIVNYDGQDPAFKGNAERTRLSDQTRLTLSAHNYRRSDRNMYFQFTAGSHHINEIPITLTDAAPLGCENFLPQNLRYFVNYQNDRDLLGNPRLLTLMSEEAAIAKGGSKYLLDRGAFETWYVADAVVKTDPKQPNVAHYWPGKKHFAPHTGSVVYITSTSNLVCGVDFQPGFLLMKEGANLYGNGHNVLVSYLAVEREISQNGSVVSLPFPMDYDSKADVDGMYFTGVTRPYYEDVDGNKGLRLEGGGILHLDHDERTNIYDYDGYNRSNNEYNFSATDGAWKELATVRNTTMKPANAGVMIVPDPDVIRDNTDIYKDADNDGIIDADSPSKLIYRFTAQGKEWEDTIYVEYADRAYKDVILGQYDDTTIDGGTTIRPGTTDQTGTSPNGTFIPGADFTEQENMGWNCIGIPYLVSDYRPFNAADDGAGIEKNHYAFEAGEENHYNMQVPHTLWLYYDGTVAPDGTTVDGDGGFYSVPSWENVETTDGSTTTNSWHIPYDAGGTMTDTPRLWMSEGFFVQTSAVANSERLRFYRPVPPTVSSPITAPQKRTTRYYSGGGEIKDNIVTDITISVRKRTVHISGLRGGEHIAIYDTAGRLYLSDTASAPLDNSRHSTEWTTTLTSPGIYIIAVDGARKKVGVK